MAEKDPGTPDESSLELPSFGLRRRRRKRGAADTAPPEQEATAPDDAQGPPPEQKVAAQEVAAQEVAAQEDSGEAEVADARDDAPAVPDEDAGEPTVVRDEPTVVIEKQAEPPAPATTPAAAPSAAETPPSPAATAHDTLVEETPAVEEDDAEAGSRSSGFTLPALGAMTAAVVTGLIIGLAMVGLTAGSMRGCKAVNGTSSCGNPGLLLLLAILITLIFAGGALLRAWNVADPGSTSFLAVGVTTVIALVFLIDVLFAWWMVIAIPLVSMLSFALSHWVATSFAEPAPD